MTEQSISTVSRGSSLGTMLLGIVFILGGVFVLGDVAIATLISAMIIGVAVIALGAFEICYAVFAGGWRGFLWHAVLGILYIIFGFVLVSQPVAGSLVLTWVIGVALVASGILRIILGMSQAGAGRWMVFISGLFGVIAGLLILSGWPESGLWVIGTFLGIDLILHGVGWVVVALKQRPSRHGPAVAR